MNNADTNTADSLYSIATHHYLAADETSCRDALAALLELEGLSERVSDLIACVEARWS